MERARVSDRPSMPERLVASQDEWPLCLVEEVNVCGSFATGTVQPGAIDLDDKFRRPVLG